MALAENQRAQVVKGPVTHQVRGELGWEAPGDPVIAEYQGVKVGVEMNGQVVWSKNIYPLFISLTDFADIPRPRYAQRIAAAERKAKKIASKLG